MNAKKQFFSYCYLIISLIFTPLAFAQTYYGKHVGDVAYRGTAIYEDEDYIYKYYEYNENDLSPVIKKAREFTAQFSRAERDLRSDIQQELKAMARDNGLDLTGFSFHLTRSNNESTITLKGQPDGAIRASVGALNLRTYAQLKYRKFGVTVAKGSVNFSTSPITMIADYDPISGKLYNINTPNLKIYSSLKFDSALKYLLPGIGSLINNFIEGKLKHEMRSAINDALNNLDYGEYSLLGLDQSLPSGVYVVGGHDVAAEIKDALQDLAPGIDFSIRLANKNYSYYVSNIPNTTNVQQFYSEYLVEIKLGSRFVLNIEDKALLKDVKLILRPDGNYYPPEDVDLPDTFEGVSHLTITEKPKLGLPGAIRYGAIPCASCGYWVSWSAATGATYYEYKDHQGKIGKTTRPYYETQNNPYYGASVRACNDYRCGNWVKK